MTIDTGKHYTATITTDKGDIQVELLPQQAPETVNNFVFLARDGFYNGLIFFLANPGFSVQGGDPSCTALDQSCRKSGGPGYDLTETVPGDYQDGTLGMANGSQFFIALTSSPEFSKYTPFARVTSGLDVAQSLSAGTKIESVQIQEQ
jgi:peptidyl-prolyl cis-trans isomerase B (cyclophilin B)